MTEDQLVRHLLLLDSRRFGLTVTDVRELAFKFATMNGLKKNEKKKGVRKRDAYSKEMANGSVLHMSESGYMTSPQGRILLIVDGHSSNSKDPNLLEKTSRLGVEMLC